MKITNGLSCVRVNNGRGDKMKRRQLRSMSHWWRALAFITVCLHFIQPALILGVTFASMPPLLWITYPIWQVFKFLNHSDWLAAEGDPRDLSRVPQLEGITVYSVFYLLFLSRLLSRVCQTRLRWVFSSMGDSPVWAMSLANNMHWEACSTPLSDHPSAWWRGTGWQRSPSGRLFWQGNYW